MTMSIVLGTAVRRCEYCQNSKNDLLLVPGFDKLSQQRQSINGLLRYHSHRVGEVRDSHECAEKANIPPGDSSETDPMSETL